MRLHARLTITGLTLVLTGLFIAALITGRIRTLAEATRQMTVPSITWFSRQGAALRERLTFPPEVTRLQEENARLRQELERLRAEQIRFTEIEMENQRLRALLRFAEEHPYYDVRGASVVGLVIGRDPALPIDRLILNIGETQGIRPGMPVVSDVGLVGRIIEVYRTTSVVLPITAPESAVNAIIQASRQTGIVRGRGEETLLMEYLPLDAAINVGDLVLTSGLGGVFPPKILIGQVIAVERHDYDMFQRAEIRPTVNFRRLEQVLILVDFTLNPEVKEILEASTPEGEP